MHHFCKLHLMRLCKRIRLPIEASYFVGFLLSAVAHELPIMVRVDD